MVFMKRFIWLAALTLGLLSLSNVAQAAVPKLITQQGRLVDSAGDPVTGDLNFVFNIYTAVDAPTPVYTEVQTITLDNGYFSARVGETTIIPDALFNGDNLWIGVTVGSDSEMSPRQQIASVPYAFRAATADNAVGAITPTSVTVNGVKVINESGAWNGAIPDRPFGSLLSTVTGAASDASGLATADADCPSGQFATGGGCQVAPSDNLHAWVKASIPKLTAGKPTGWRCYCSSSGDDVTCRVTPSVICATN